MTDAVWVSDRWRTLFGFATSEPVEFADVRGRIHPEDRVAFGEALTHAIDGTSRYEIEYRIVLPDGQQRWIGSRARVEYGAGGEPVFLRGVSLDITARKEAELEVQQQRKEVTHLSRVTMLGELSGALAHELNQPLTAILSNAQAARRFLARDSVDSLSCATSCRTSSTRTSAPARSFAACACCSAPERRSGKAWT